MSELFDAHAHFVSDDFARYPLTDDVPGRFPPPGRVGLRERVAAVPLTAENILGWWDASGVAGGVGVQYRTAYGTDNSYLLDCARRWPDRIRPVVVVDGADPATPGTLANLATRGVAGLRLTGVAEAGYPWLESDAVLDTWAAADALGLAVVLMYVPPGTSAAALRHIAATAARFPNTRVVLDHIGWLAPLGAPDYGVTAGHRAVAELPNVHLKLTTLNLEHAAAPTDELVAHLVRVFGADRLMWGSDVGNSPGSYPELVDLARTATRRLDPAERAAVLGGTARRVFVR
jgi:predicted TIM-barrel fold metal-dependent hydrolase